MNSTAPSVIGSFNYVVIGSCIQLVVSVLIALTTTVVKSLTPNIETTEIDIVRKIDQMLKKKSCVMCSKTTSSIGIKPGNGVHIMWSKCLPYVLLKTETETARGSYDTYTIYGIRLESFVRSIHPEKKGVRVTMLEKLAPWSNNFSNVTIPSPKTLFKFQETIVRDIIAEYTKNKNQKGTTALVCGPTGKGKSTLAILIANALKKSRVVPKVLDGFSPTIKNCGGAPPGPRRGFGSYAELSRKAYKNSQPSPGPRLMLCLAKH